MGFVDADDGVLRPARPACDALDRGAGARSDWIRFWGASTLEECGNIGIPGDRLDGRVWLGFAPIGPGPIMAVTDDERR